MTEAQWLACEDPEKLIGGLGRKASKRKRRLFACACCYRIWTLIPDERGRAAVIAAEQFADGLIDGVKLELRERGAKVAVWGQYTTRSARDAASACSFVADGRVGNAIHAHQSVNHAKQSHAAEQKGTNPERSDYIAIVGEARAEESAQQVALLHDIFGNPSRSVLFSPQWRTDTATALAQQMYESHDFGAMPILADALQDAGCDDEDILSHCRGDGPHVRGCWVIDLVLGKG